MKKSLRIVLTLGGIERDTFETFVSFLARGVQALADRDGVDGAMMRIEEILPDEESPKSAAPASTSVLN